MISKTSAASPALAGRCGRDAAVRHNTGEREGSLTGRPRRIYDEDGRHRNAPVNLRQVCVRELIQVLGLGIPGLTQNLGNGSSGRRLGVSKDAAGADHVRDRWPLLAYYDA